MNSKARKKLDKLEEKSEETKKKVETTNSEVKTYQIIYPCYLDSEKKVSEGRRLPKNKSCVSPTAKEIFDVCTILNLKCELEVVFKNKNRKTKNTQKIF
jgi:signal recognition particle subunit SEC65